jgi:hypothetical protein
VEFLRVELGVLLDNLTRVYNVLAEKGAGNTKETKDTPNSE